MNKTSKPENKDMILGILAGLAATTIWGAMYVISKAVMPIIPPFSLIFLRLSLGIITLSTFLLVRKSYRITRKQFGIVFAVGIIGYGVSLGFQFIGTNLSTAGNASLVTSATPAFIFLFSFFILKENITRRRFLALIIASLGVLCVIDPRTIQRTSDLFWGNLALIAASLTWALYSVLIRRVTRSIDVLTTSLIAFTGGLPVCLPLGVWEAITQGYGEINWKIIIGVLFLGIISTALAMYLWNSAFSKVEAGVASLTFFAQPVVGTILGIAFLEEKITPLFVLGGVLIGIGLIISKE